MVSWSFRMATTLQLATVCSLVILIAISISGCNETDNGFLASSNSDSNTTEEEEEGGGGSDEITFDEEQLEFAEAGLLNLEAVAEGTEAEEEQLQSELLSMTGEGSYASARPPSCCILGDDVAVTQMTWADFEQNYANENITNQVPVVVPCGFEVSVTSSPSQDLAGLQVMGHLKFTNAADVTLTTQFIFVCGKFSIGTESQAHQSKVEIVLAGNVNVTWPKFNSSETNNFGTAGFITYGGDTVLHGSACGTTTWGRLAKPVSQPAAVSTNPESGDSKREVSQSSLGHWRYVAERAIDGSRGTDMMTKAEARPWWQMKIPSSLQGGLGIVRVTLGQKSSDHALFFDGTARTRYRNIHGKVYDGLNQGAIIGVSDQPCSDIGDRCGGTECGKITTPSQDGRYEIDCQGKSGQYVYVILPGDRRKLQFDAIEVFPADVGGVDVELAGNGQTNWKVGEKLVITSTSFNALETEEVTILSKNGEKFQTSAVKNYHDGCDPATDSSCMFAAEVASLNRNIVIRGGGNCEDAEKPRCGHFMIAHTDHAFVCGVEFTNLGQPGNEGRYPVHIHMAGTAPSVIVKNNALHHNHQRGVVIHATKYATFESNLCYITNGHCFMTEDGGEEHNRIINNVGVLVKPLDFGCSHSHDRTFLCPSRSDNSPNAFWIANTNNFFEGNVGVVENIAYRVETRHVMGLTRRMFPQEARQIGHNGKLKGRIPIGSFKNNVAHSSKTGYFNYPRFNPTEGKFEGFLSWRNNVGMSVHNSRTKLMTIDGARLFDVNLAARAGTGAARINLINSKMQGRGDKTSGPFGVKGLHKNAHAIPDVYVSTDAYTRNWARCFGNYRTTGIDRRAVEVLEASFVILNDQAHHMECSAVGS